MINSLKGYARNTWLTLHESASPIHSIDKLEGIYGNVYSNDTLLLSFYAEKQMNGQSVADYGMTLEYILQKVYETGILNPEGYHICLLWRDTVSAGRRHTNGYELCPSSSRFIFILI